MQTRIITLIAWACLSSASLFGCGGGDDSSGSNAGAGGTTGTGGGSNNGTGGLLSTGCYTAFDYSTYTPGATARTLTTDVQPIFAVSCAISSACHLTSSSTIQHPFLGPPSGTTPTPDQIAAIRSEIVGVKAIEFPSANMVTAGDPGNSWLMLKVDTPIANTISCSCPSSNLAPGCGTPMPQGGPALAADKKAIIRDWIKGGATL